MASYRRPNLTVGEFTLLLIAVCLLQMYEGCFGPVSSRSAPRVPPAAARSDP